MQLDQVIKMGKYGQAAVAATKLLVKGDKQSPVDAWSKAVNRIFPDSESSRNKGCPRATYLGLCEEGLVKGVPASNYNKQGENKNKRYGINAVLLLRANPNLTNDKSLLWEMVPDTPKTHNEQMDVVCALWEANLIKT
jgi:hypothetical protein